MIAPAPPPQPRVLAGRYRLDSVIGKGSMGTVWAATDEVLHRQVAIKEIDFPVGTPAAERAQLEARTLREARAIARLSNPYVITLFDILTLSSGPVIVMELLRSRSLAEILRRVGRLPDGQAATIGVAVASGLLAAHAAGITHRDVKPGNVLICDDGRIKLTDFGIARASGEQTMTATGLLLGSPAYIAPEVANGVPTGPISDAWSLGGLLFACVEGRPPFDQGTAIATLTSVVKDPVPPHPHSDRLGAVVSGLLVKTPNLRMRIDRALTIMRGIADDPSGTYLAAAAKIPREDAAAAPGQYPPSGTAGPAQQSAARSMPPGRLLPAVPPPTGHPPTTSPADASTNPPGVPQSQWTGGGRHAAPEQRPPAPPPASRPAPPRQDPQSSLRPFPGGTAGGYTGAPVPVVGLGPRVQQGQELPPPPWAQSGSAGLAPLPEVAAEQPFRWRGLVAVLMALIAAIAGFFGVRIIADLATDESASAAAPALTSQDPDPIDPLAG